MLVLDVRDGEQRRTLRLEDGTIRIGRDPDCEIFLPGDPTLSRVHAIFEHVDNAWSVRDNDSRNGTTMRGVQLPATNRFAVTTGDRLAVGKFVLVVTSTGEALDETLPAHAVPIRPVAGLSLRETEIVRAVASGLTDQQVADSLFISVKTVHSHLDRIGDKTGSRKRADVTRLAMETGLL